MHQHAAHNTDTDDRSTSSRDIEGDRGQPTAPEGRLRSLDSLRGIAALVVVGQHVLLSFPDSRNPVFNAARLLFILGGQFAVILFFVLSGFVLTLPYTAGKALGYGPFLVRRVCRLYAPFAFAVLVSAWLSGILGGASTPLVSDWLLHHWRPPLTGNVIASHLLMTGIHDEAIRLDGPIWSLIVEMRVSIIFPLLVLFATRFRWTGVAAAFVLSLASAKGRTVLGETSALTADSPVGAVLFTAYYLLMFLIGATLATQMSRIQALFQRAPKALHMASFGALSVAFLALTYLTPPYLYRTVKDVFCGVFAGYVIACVVSFPRLQGALSLKGLIWLGDISYSFYLIHLPVLMALIYVLYPIAPLWLIVSVALPLMLLAGHLMHHAVERPSLRFGRSLSQRL